MDAAVPRPTRLLPLRLLGAGILVAQSVAFTKTVADRNDLLAQYPGLSQKLLAILLAVIFFGAMALAFLAFWRQRFGLWIVLACAAAQLALETWAGFSPLALLRIPVAAALVFLAARHAWPELRRVADVR